MLLGISWAEARDAANKGNPPTTRNYLSPSVSNAGLRNPDFHSENGSHIALLQNVQIEAPRMFKIGRPFWARKSGELPYSQTQLLEWVAAGEWRAGCGHSRGKDRDRRSRQLPQTLRS